MLTNITGNKTDIGHVFPSAIGSLLWSY